jgi:hypothetical protein
MVHASLASLLDIRSLDQRSCLTGFGCQKRHQDAAPRSMFPHWQPSQCATATLLPPFSPPRPDDRGSRVCGKGSPLPHVHCRTPPTEPPATLQTPTQMVKGTQRHLLQCQLRKRKPCSTNKGILNQTLELRVETKTSRAGRIRNKKAANR